MLFWHLKNHTEEVGGSEPQIEKEKYFLRFIDLKLNFKLNLDWCIDQVIRANNDKASLKARQKCK